MDIIEEDTKNDRKKAKGLPKADDAAKSATKVKGKRKNKAKK